MHKDKAQIIKIAGPLVIAKGLEGVKMAAQNTSDLIFRKN